MLIDLDQHILILCLKFRRLSKIVVKPLKLRAKKNICRSISGKIVHRTLRLITRFSRHIAKNPSADFVPRATDIQFFHS